MSVTRPADVPVAGSPALMAELRSSIARAGYTTDALRALLQVSGELSSRPLDMQVHDRRTRDGSGLATIVRLFALGLDVPEDTVSTALAPVTLAQLEQLGLIEVAGGRVRALARLGVHGDVLLACDRPGGGGANHVTGVNSPAVLLAQLAVRKGVARTLDLGTGNGIQGILAAIHSDVVISTDVNPRALAFAGFNAALNGITNLETRLGSLYEPVAGESFGLILSNPPYVISPESALVYRDSGRGPGEICRDVIRGAGDHLAEDGYAQALVSWPMGAGQAWDEPLRAWLPPGADAWLLHYQSEDPLTHAAKWNRPVDDAGTGNRAEVLDRWLEYDAREGVAQIGFGAVFLHRAVGSGARVFVSEARGSAGSAGRQVQRVFTALRGDPVDDRALGATVFVPVAEQRIDQVARPAPDGSWTIEGCTVRLAEGVGSEGTIDATLATVLTGFDGRRPLAAVVDAAAAQLGIEARELWPPAAAMVRRLCSLGFLVRTDVAPVE